MNGRRASMALFLAGPLIVALFTGGTWALGTVAQNDWQAENTTLIGVQGPGEDGSVAALGPGGELAWRTDRTYSYHDVTRLDNGNVLAAYAAITPGCRTLVTCEGVTGFRIIDPSGPEIVAEWSKPVRTVGNSEIHDVEPLPDGRFLVLDMDLESLYIVDLETGDREWVWNASSYYGPDYEPARVAMPDDPTREDWLHINDVDRLGPDHYMVSVRNANQIVFIRNGSVVDVINEDHHPGLLEGQHNPQWLGPGAVLVADSGNNRAIELHRNDSTGRWEPVWSLESAAGLALEWPRDADRLPNGNTLVTDSLNNRVFEVTETGQVVNVATVPANPYEADMDGVGEPVGGPTYSKQTGKNFEGKGLYRMGPISKALIGLRHTVHIPFWISEWHLIVTLIGVNIMSLGLIVETLDRKGVFRG